MSLSIITASERLAQNKGVKALVVGPPGVGKTSLLKTLPPESVLLMDLEDGDMAVADFACDKMEPRTWPECRNLACLLAGPNPALPPNEPYSQAHYDKCVETYGEINLSKYDTVFVDSLTVASRWCFTWCKQQPFSFNKKGDPDLLGTYGGVGREMVAFATQLQHIKDKNVVLTAIQDVKEDDFGRKSFVMQMEGSKAGRDIPGIVDVVLAYNFVQFEDKTRRAFVTTPDNPHGFPSKDRSGKLDTYEQPHLGKLFDKINQSAK
jgi:hypothetical protein